MSGSVKCYGDVVEVDCYSLAQKIFRYPLCDVERFIRDFIDELEYYIGIDDDCVTYFFDRFCVYLNLDICDVSKQLKSFLLDLGFECADKGLSDDSMYIVRYEL